MTTMLVIVDFCHLANRFSTVFFFTGVLLLFVSGMNIGWGIWRYRTSEPYVLNISWFVFAIVGSMVGAVLVTSFTKKTIYVSSGTTKR